MVVLQGIQLLLALYFTHNKKSTSNSGNVCTTATTTAVQD